MRRMSFLLLVGVLVFALSGSYGAYMFFQKSSLVNELNQANGSLSVKKKEVLDYQNKKLTQAISAKQVLNDLELNGIKWSKVIKRIRQTLPVTESGPVVEVLSYSASGNKSISLNLKTIAGAQTPYFDVAKLIRSFDGSEFFKDNFVPSISAGTDDEGKEILSFALLTNYGEPVEEISSEEELEEALVEVLDESLVDDSSDASAKEGLVPVPR